MNINKYLTISFWNEFFEKHGFEEEESYMGDITHCWYSCGKFMVGYKTYDIEERKAPRFCIAYKRGKDKDVVVNGTIIIKTGQLFEQFLQALTNPEELPLFVNFEWAEPLIAAYFADSSI